MGQQTIASLVPARKEVLATWYLPNLRVTKILFVRNVQKDEEVGYFLSSIWYLYLFVITGITRALVEKYNDILFQ